MATSSIHSVITTLRGALKPVKARDTAEHHRAATPLELFFDLVFVIAIAETAKNLHHSIVEGHILVGLLCFFIVFFGLWWAWMAFTWFSTAYDNNDWLYRVLTISQMVGVLILASSIKAVFTSFDFRFAVFGYVVMRTPLLIQWLRVALHDRENRTLAKVYFYGLGLVQLLWIGWLFVPAGRWQYAVLVALMLEELVTPIAAELAGGLKWHPGHVVERYGLFTIILLGEGLLASANALSSITAGGHNFAVYLLMAIAAVVVIASMWWIYFWAPHPQVGTSFGRNFLFSYGHVVVFGTIIMVSVGLELHIDVLSGHGASSLVARMMTAFPLVVFIASYWVVGLRFVAPATVNLVLGAAVVAIGAAVVIPGGILVMCVALVCVVACLIVYPPRVTRRSGKSAA